MVKDGLDRCQGLVGTAGKGLAGKGKNEEKLVKKTEIQAVFYYVF